MAGNKRTPERLALLRQLCAEAEAWPAILLRINALPGPPIASVGALQVWASEAGIRRSLKPASTTPAPRPPAVPQLTSFPAPPLTRTPGQRAYARAMTMPAERPDTTTPIVADYEAIRQRVALWGIQMNSRDDLGAINAHAARIGHRPFVIATPGRGRAA